MKSKAKLNEKYIRVLWYIVFQVLKVPRIKEYKITASLPVLLFLAVLQRIRIYISRYHFYNFLEHNPTFTGKEILPRIFIL